MLGAGTMGNGIAHVFARAGYAVILRDVDERLLDRAARNHLHKSRPRNQERQSRRSRKAANPRAHRSRSPILPRIAARRFRRRGRARTARAKANGARRSRPCAAPRRHPGHQYLLDLRDRACRRQRPPRSLHRHALHESGAGDDAGGSHPRATYQRRRLRSTMRLARNSARRPWP